MIMKKYVAPELEVVLLGDGAGMIFASSTGENGEGYRGSVSSFSSGEQFTGTTAATSEWVNDMFDAYQAAKGGAADGSVWTDDAGTVDDGAPEGLVSEVMMPQLSESSGIISDGILPDAAAGMAAAAADMAAAAADAPVSDWTDGGVAAEDAPASEFGAE